MLVELPKIETQMLAWTIFNVSYQSSIYGSWQLFSEIVFLSAQIPVKPVLTFMGLVHLDLMSAVMWTNCIDYIDWLKLESSYLMLLCPVVLTVNRSLALELSLVLKHEMQTGKWVFTRKRLQWMSVMYPSKGIRFCLVRSLLCQPGAGFTNSHARKGGLLGMENIACYLTGTDKKIHYWQTCGLVSRVDYSGFAFSLFSAFHCCHLVTLWLISGFAVWVKH